MARHQNNTYCPEILGMGWIPGNLILVGSLSWGGRLEYVLGNCIVGGTKDEIPAALFAPKGKRQYFMERLLRMQLGKEVFDKGRFSAKDLKYYPLYIDDTPQLTIPYLVGQIFRLVEQQGVQMVIINRLQDIDGSVLEEWSREGELNSTLRLLKALAESLSILIIVTSKLSRRLIKENRPPTVNDILDVTEAEEHCDQVILIHPLDPFVGKAKMILPLGHPYYKGAYGEQVLNVSLDEDKQYFKKATALFEEEGDLPRETPVYQWYRGASDGEWDFEFLDSGGMGWTLVLEPLSGDNGRYRISAHSWAGDEIMLDDPGPYNDIDLARVYALDRARRFFPDVEIPETNLS